MWDPVWMFFIAVSRANVLWCTKLIVVYNCIYNLVFISKIEEQNSNSPFPKFTVKSKRSVTNFYMFLHFLYHDKLSICPKNIVKDETENNKMELENMNFAPIFHWFFSFLLRPEYTFILFWIIESLRGCNLKGAERPKVRSFYVTLILRKSQLTRDISFIKKAFSSGPFLFTLRNELALVRQKERPRGAAISVIKTDPKVLIV